MAVARLLIFTCLVVSNCAVVAAREIQTADRIVVVRDKAPLQVKGKQLGVVADCTVFTVDAVQGHWLWIKSQKGFLSRNDVILFEDAIAHYTRKLQSSRTADNFWKRSQIWRLKGELQIALSDINEAIRLNPTNATWFVRRGIIHSAMRDVESAKADYTEAIRLDPTKTAAYSNRATCWYQLGKLDEALSDYADAIRYSDERSQVQGFSSLELGGGDSDRQHNELAGLYEGRGLVWLVKGDLDKAMADFDEAIRRNPDGFKAYLERGGIWRRKGDLEKAIADFDEAIRCRPKNPWNYDARGNAWMAKKEVDKAIEDYTQSVTLDPKYAQAFHHRGEAWFAKRDFDRSIEDFGNTIRLEPTNASAFAHRGYAWIQKAECRKAINDFEEAIRIAPQAISYLADYAWVLSTSPDDSCRDGTKAVQLAKKACDLSGGKYTNAFGTLSAAYAECGEFDKAIQALDKAISLDQQYDVERRAELRKAFESRRPFREVP